MAQRSDNKPIVVWPEWLAACGAACEEVGCDEFLVPANRYSRGGRTCTPTTVPLVAQECRFECFPSVWCSRYLVGLKDIMPRTDRSSLTMSGCLFERVLAFIAELCV